MNGAMSGFLLLAIRLALTLAVYAFIGWAIFVLWNDLRRQTSLVKAPPVRPLLLRPVNIPVENGQSSKLPERRFFLPEVGVGRDPACDLHLEDKTISAQHARLSYHHGQWWVEDLRSTNGTFVNEEPVAEPLVLASGDTLRFGQIKLQVQVEEKDAAG